MNKTFVVLFPLLILACLEGIFLYVEKIWYFAAAVLILIFMACWTLTKRQLISRDFLPFLISPMLFILSLIGFLAFVEYEMFYHVASLVGIVFLGLYLRQVFIYFYQPHRYRAYSIENLSSYLNLLTIFLFYVAVYSLIIFLNLPLWMLLAAVLVFSYLTVYQDFWVNKIIDKDRWIYILVIALIMLELYWSVSYLPTSFYVNSLILTSSYYLMIGLSKAKLLKKLEKKLAARYIIIVIAIMLIILVTAQWY